MYDIYAQINYFPQTSSGFMWRSLVSVYFCLPQNEAHTHTKVCFKLCVLKLSWEVEMKNK